MSKARKPPPPWRSGQYTPLGNDLLRALAGCTVRHELSARACAVLLVMYGETWGAHGDHYRQFGRAAAPLSVSKLAATLGTNRKTVFRALAELKEQGWARQVTPHSGTRAATWEPSVMVPTAATSEPEPESERAATEADRQIISEYLAAKHEERRREVAERARSGSRLPV